MFPLGGLLALLVYVFDKLDWIAWRTADLIHYSLGALAVLGVVVIVISQVLKDRHKEENEGDAFRRFAVKRLRHHFASLNRLLVALPTQFNGVAYGSCPRV